MLFEIFYGVYPYSERYLAKLERKKGGIWNAFDLIWICFIFDLAQIR